jgi:urease accessory protein
MSKSVARLGIGGPVGSGKTALLEGLVPMLTQQGIEVAVVTNDLLTTRLVRKLVKPSSSGLREFRTQARIYSKIRVGNSY